MNTILPPSFLTGNRHAELAQLARKDADIGFERHVRCEDIRFGEGKHGTRIRALVVLDFRLDAPPENTAGIVDFFLREFDAVDRELAGLRLHAGDLVDDADPDRVGGYRRIADRLLFILSTPQFEMTAIAYDALQPVMWQMHKRDSASRRRAH